jgi:Flp pilus assembly protein TadD
MLKRLLGSVFGGQRTETVALLHGEAAALLAAGRLTDARVKAEEARELAPGAAHVLHLLGVICHAHGDTDTGSDYFRRALSADRRNVDLHMDFGNALRVSGDMEGAEIQFRTAAQLAPDRLNVHLALGSLLLELSRPTEAAAELSKALALAPADAASLRLAALAAFRTQDFAAALAFYERIERKDLLDFNEHSCYGICLMAAGSFDRARKEFEAGLAQAPAGSKESAIIARNLAYCHLIAGDWREGFKLHERRHDCRDRLPAREDDTEEADWLAFVDQALGGIPAWTSGDCRGKRVLVWVEQGRGDIIMLLRLLPVLLDEWGAQEATLLGNRAYEAVLSLCHRASVLSVEPEWRPDPGRYDLQCSIMSLPYLMDLTPDRIPGTVPYVEVSPARSAAWRTLVRALPGLRVGLVWAGNPKLPLDTLRTVPLASLAPLFSVPGISYVSLQKDAAVREELVASGLPVADWMDRCKDFMETAALIDNLDLVISVDTAVAHLAGALGKPVWLLNRHGSEWRWLHGREASVWYPTMRIFNQAAAREWEPVIVSLVAELRLRAGRQQP